MEEEHDYKIRLRGGHTISVRTESDLISRFQRDEDWEEEGLWVRAGEVVAVKKSGVPDYSDMPSGVHL